MCRLLHAQAKRSTQSKQSKQMQQTLQRQGIGLVNLANPNKICQHGLGQRSYCPLCHSHAYMVKRIKNSVQHGFARLDIKHKCNDKDYLQHLEVVDWHEACLHIVRKMDSWNEKHACWPERQMTILNTSTDHIRPIRQFKDDLIRVNTARAKQERVTVVSVNCCNHHTNLQPMLIFDNTWKADTWNKQDEKFWLQNIILQPNYNEVYFCQGKPQPSLLAFEQNDNAHMTE